MAAPSSSREWADLHGDVLTEISKFLISRVEKLHMRAVCTSWRFYCPLPPKTPSSLALPFPIAPYPRHHRYYNRKGHYVLTESTIYGLQPLNSCDNAKPWIVKFDDNRLAPGKAKFIHPLYKNAVLNTEPWPKVLNSLDYRVTELGKDYYSAFVENRAGQIPRIDEDSCCSIKNFVVSKPFTESNEGLAVMALHTDRELAVWRTGEKKWSVVKGGRKGSCYIRAAFFNGLFYAIELDGSVITIDLVSLKITRLITAMINTAQPCVCKLLLKSFGDLFLIHRYGMSSYDFRDAKFEDDGVMHHFKLEVYKLNVGKREWVPVKKLKDRVLFVSDYRCSFSTMTKDFAGLRGNCVFYLDHYMCSGSAGVFDLEDDVTWKVAQQPSFSNIFWPPPAWINKESAAPQN